jgi:hypothetical protein
LFEASELSDKQSMLKIKPRVFQTGGFSFGTVLIVSHEAPRRQAKSPFLQGFSEFPLFCKGLKKKAVGEPN